MKLRSELCLGKEPGFIAALAHDDGNPEFARNQQGFVAEIAGGSGGIYKGDSLCFSSITAGEHVKLNAARFQEFAEKQHEWGLARSADRQVAHADDGALQAVRAENAAII